jgi:hypothetical protein
MSSTICQQNDRHNFNHTIKCSSIHFEFYVVGYDSRVITTRPKGDTGDFGSLDPRGAQGLQGV